MTRTQTEQKIEALLTRARAAQAEERRAFATHNAALVGRVNRELDLIWREVDKLRRALWMRPVGERVMV